MVSPVIYEESGDAKIMILGINMNIPTIQRPILHTAKHPLIVYQWVL